MHSKNIFSIFALAIRNDGCNVQNKCGNSSVGRAQPCQGWGREFESRFPLKMRKTASGCLFSFCTRANYGSPEATPLRGWGCKYKFAINRSRAARARVSFSAQTKKQSKRTILFGKRFFLNINHCYSLVTHTN